MNISEKIRVGLDSRSYDIIVGREILSESAILIRDVLKQKRVIIVTDKNVAKRYLKPLRKSLDREKIKYNTIILPPGESTKSFKYLEKLIEKLLNFNPERNITLIALGGGVIGDLTGFAASILLRGVNFIQIPTTLLAMVDSSVGGKTGINTKYGKNLVGSFHQPKLVIADIDLLETLPERELLAGYAEVVKYGLINDERFFERLEKNSDNFNYEDMIITSCKAKAAVVSMDEKESGMRALLNLGHSFGHAMEAETGYSDKLLHGEAVAIGMVMAFQFSGKLGLCGETEVSRVKNLLAAVGLPTSPLQIKKKLRAKKLLRHMKQDKKVQDGRIVLVLVEGIGRALIKKDIDEKEVLEFLEDILQGGV